MRVRLLSSHVIEPKRLQPLTTFLIDDHLAIDGGSIGISLDLEAQRRLRSIVLTHVHADHVATLPVFVAEVLPFLQEPVRIYAAQEVLDDVRSHIFNDLIWPDFHRIRIPGTRLPGLEYVPIEPKVPFHIHGLTLRLVPVNHTVHNSGVLAKDAGGTVLFTSDTSDTDDIWDLANASDDLRAVFVDVSYPEEMEHIAAASKHLTPLALERQLRKLARDVPIFAVHLKPQFRETIIQQLQNLRHPGIRVCELDREYVF
jgi:cAMP phosphodiesterase